jgi:GT2 family glycosyltransferase
VTGDGVNPLNSRIVLVNYNGLPDTHRCLRSLEAAGRPACVVVDNASAEDPSPVLRRDFPWCPAIRNPVNGGWAGGNNFGARYALERGAELIVLLNNDTVVAPDFLTRLAAAAVAYPDYGILGPVIRLMEPPHEVQTDGCLFNEPALPGFFQRKPVDLVTAAVPAVTDVDIVNGCCMMVRAEVFHRIGFIDERFFLIHEESDFCLRARRAGFRSGVLGEALVWHKGSSSFRRTGRRWQRYYDARNLYLLLSKHTATHRRGRGPLRSLWEYLKYTYYRYATEREAGHADAADAVVEGVHDALVRRFGPFRAGSRPAVPLLRGVFEAWRATRPVSPPKESPGHAIAVR